MSSRSSALVFAKMDLPCSSAKITPHSPEVRVETNVSIRFNVLSGVVSEKRQSLASINACVPVAFERQPATMLSLGTFDSPRPGQCLDLDHGCFKELPHRLGACRCYAMLTYLNR